MVACLLVAFCGDEGGLSEPPSGNPPEIVLRGGERLAWDQDAPSIQELGRYTFVLYIDGVPSALGDLLCATTPGPSGYECSGQLPAMTAGRHILELTTKLAALESGRSAGSAVTVGSTRIVTFVENPPPAVVARRPSVATPAGIVCLARAAECYDVALAATGVGTVAAVTATPDGRLLFVEDSRHVRVVQGGRLSASPALSLETASSRITGVGVAPDHVSTGTAYVAWIEEERDGWYELSVSRYRDVQGTFGEGAVIITGLRVPGSTATTPLAVDSEGALYLAVPSAGDNVASRSEFAFNRRILRFTRDGTVPATNPLPSPVIAEGYSRPSTLASDTATGRIWAAGTDPRWSHAAASFALNQDRGAEWPLIPRPAASALGRMSEAPQGPALALTMGEEKRWLWFLPTPGAVHRGPLQPDGRLGQLERVALERLGAVAMIAQGAGGNLYVVAHPGAGSPDGPSIIWYLTPHAAVRR